MINSCREISIPISHVWVGWASSRICSLECYLWRHLHVRQTHRWDRLWKRQSRRRTIGRWNGPVQAGLLWSDLRSRTCRKGQFFFVFFFLIQWRHDYRFYQAELLCFSYRLARSFVVSAWWIIPFRIPKMLFLPRLSFPRNKSIAILVTTAWISVNFFSKETRYKHTAIALQTFTYPWWVIPIKLLPRDGSLPWYLPLWRPATQKPKSNQLSIFWDRSSKSNFQFFKRNHYSMSNDRHAITLKLH